MLENIRMAEGKCRVVPILGQMEVNRKRRLRDEKYSQATDITIRDVRIKTKG